MLKTEIVTISDEGRDKGKTFVVREMPAAQTEKWAIRALLALASGGIDLDFDPATAGFAELAAVGVSALPRLKFEELEPLLDQMFSTISIRPDPRHPEVERPVVESDIEEVATRITLRKNWIGMHSGFLKPGAH